MTFNSLQFLIFLPVVIAVYFILPHKVRWIWLLGASYYAYMSWNPMLVFLILATTVVSYLAGLFIPKTENHGAKTCLLVVTLVVCLGLLVFFKYFGFLLGSVVAVINLFTPTVVVPEWVNDIILPIGISFYTFQTLSYVIDVYRGTIQPEKHFGYYALFVSYFPQLVAGPIERPENLLPQLKEKHKVNADDLSAGLRLLLVGFFRKCVVADFCGVFVDNVYANLGEANSLTLLVVGALFSVQVYCDFGGYSEIAMGAARMMGIKLTRNFDRPFAHETMRDHMRHWHITLTSWFTDYVYIPLGGGRRGKARKYLNIFIVYLLSGLWHGASWNYALWGVYLGAVMIIESLLRKPCAKLCDKIGLNCESPLMKLVRHGYILLLMGISTYFFRAQTLGDTMLIFGNLFTKVGFGIGYLEETLAVLSMSVLDLLELVAILAVMLKLYDFACYEGDKIYDLSLPLGRSEYTQSVATYGYFVLAIALGWLILLSGGAVSTFVYFQF